MERTFAILRVSGKHLLSDERIKPQETVFLSRRSRIVSYLEDERDSSEPQWLLPDNIWLRIFSYLSLQQRTQASYVCQRWNNLCKDSTFWREVDFKFSGATQPVTDETVKAVTSYSRGIQSIDLSGDHCKPITDEAIGHVARSCQRLQRLNIAGRTKVSNRGLSVIARNCPHLKELNVEKCHGISNNGIKSIASRCHELKSLSVARCQQISDKGMYFVAQECKNLQSLNIAGCSSITDKSLTTLGKHCNMLRDINLKDIQGITSYGIERMVSGNPNLTHVHLGIVQDTKNTMVALQIIVKHCEKLEFLSFQHFHRAGVVTGGVRKVNKKKLGAFINGLNACVVSNNR
ncbi:F-box/LRR-repeat protein 17 [Stylophora pistillata]|uniref:F-box/LRR-repeat protein 17 n=1 Tax=Stylophora pistillata TaxID=50429 RepID=A0A2B4SF91_STYPI|nr:F-box/LRR-repeat protein 17 [Stylophora pistillata]